MLGTICIVGSYTNNSKSTSVILKLIILLAQSRHFSLVKSYTLIINRSRVSHNDCLNYQLLILMGPKEVPVATVFN